MIVFVIELYTRKLYVYGVLPPNSYAENVSYVVPASTTVLDAAIVGVASPVFTVIVPVSTEFAFEFALSVTNTFA